MRGNSDRFYIKDGLGEEDLVITDEQMVRQWLKVLRLDVGDQVRLLDGQGLECNYELLITNYEKGTGGGKLLVTSDQLLGNTGGVRKMNKKMRGVLLKLVGKKFCENEKPEVVLAFGVLKSRDRMEWLVEKATELGVTAFVPLQTDNVVIKKMSGENRLQKKIVEAVEQSGRLWMPKLESSMNIEECVKKYQDYKLLILDSVGENIEKINLNEKNILLVGPEGGWSEKEKEYFSNIGCQMVKISNNILRAETAGVLGVGLVRQVIE